MSRYREIQYFHPLVYAAIAALIAALVAVVARDVSAGQPAGASGVLAAVCGGLALMVGALGRMVVEVDDTRLTISFGWLGLVRRSFDLRRIDSVRVCLFRPLREYLGWGWRYGLDGSVCYTTRGRRGLELRVGGSRHIVGSVDPRRLKCAITKQEEAEEPPAEQAHPPSKTGQRILATSNWGLLHPDDLGGESRLI